MQLKRFGPCLGSAPTKGEHRRKVWLMHAKQTVQLAALTYFLLLPSPRIEGIDVLVAQPLQHHSGRVLRSDIASLSTPKLELIPNQTRHTLIAIGMQDNKSDGALSSR